MDSSIRDRFQNQSASLYPKLDPGTKAIRLILLVPGPWSEQIKCHLFETKIPTKRPYKALSYAWKNHDDSEDVPIHINGRTISMKSNLHAAMRRLRQPREPVEIWVDSLCINQTDDSERTQQVTMMREIYHNSSEVVIWLGESRIFDDLGDSLQPMFTRRSTARPLHEDELARVEWDGTEGDLPKLNAYLFAITQKIGGPVANNNIRDIFGAFCVLYLLSTKVPAAKIWHLRHIDYSMPIVKGLYAIMDQAWWRRMWVVQETVVAEKATIVYGKLSAPWSMFANAALEYDRTHLLSNVNSVYPYLHDGQPLMHFSRIVTEVELTRRQWLHVQPTSLLPLLRKFRSRDATDGRDKVFSLLGLVRYWRGKEIHPDYSLTADEVFWETTTKLIAGTKSLSVLAGTLQSNSTKWELVPSWIADWACPPEVHENVRLGNLPLYDAAKGLSSAIQVHGRSILETSGYHLDEVAFVGRELPLAAEGASSRLRIVVSEWEKSLEKLGTEALANAYVGGGTVADAFWRLLCGDTEYCKEEEEETGLEKIEFRRANAATARIYEQWRWVDRGVNRRTSIIGGYWQEVGGGDGVQDKNAFHHAVECASGFRKLFITKKGYIGTGPGNIRRGDGVFVLFGSRVPFILRNSSRTRICNSETVQVLISDEPALIDIQKGPKKTLVKQPKEPMKEPIKKTCSDTHDICHHVVGDCYVHGIMDGEGAATAKLEGRTLENVFLI